MKKLMIIALILVGALLVPSVAADKTIYDQTYEYTGYEMYSASLNEWSSGNGYWYPMNNLYITRSMIAANPESMMVQGPGGIDWISHSVTQIIVNKNTDQWPVTFSSGGNVIGTGTFYYFQYTVGSTNYVQIGIDFEDVDWSRVSGTAVQMSSAPSGSSYPTYNHNGYGTASPASYLTLSTPGMGAVLWDGSHGCCIPSVINYHTVVASDWVNRFTVVDLEDSLHTTQVDILRNVDSERIGYSRLYITDAVGRAYSSVQETVDETFYIQANNYPIAVSLDTYLGTWYNFTVDLDSHSQPRLRTGTVTMTDNNGTSISGFDVTAVNHYTGEEYTVSTDTDVAEITLPMDRTIEIRNPQTGEYEEAPVGYYKFFGQSPGYKMLNEDGIRVSVMPQKYGSYQLCDIRVTSESGYLSGTHQFQIRSRADNSILQSGTISAKSATTGEWYNTTVIDGIATLLLPYDTSNSVSQYAGNYYVYATSPGFEDSDYGTQIVVMPHTVSEIRDILLTPIGGIPTSGNVTLRIQAFSETGSGVVNAEIFVAGVLGAGASVWDTYTASSTGYLTVSVPGNSTYDIVASGAGYYDSARRVEVFDTDPGLIEIKLYSSGTPPIDPTSQPTGWVTPTPTQTAPIEEDNIIGLSVKGLAKGFGIDYDTALLLFGLMIVFGAGGIVMNSVKGGAMEFIAGSIVGTFVAFALGLIPIWIFIIIAVVFGAYVLRVFLQGGQ